MKNNGRMSHHHSNYFGELFGKKTYFGFRERRDYTFGHCQTSVETFGLNKETACTFVWDTDRLEKTRDMNCDTSVAAFSNSNPYEETTMGNKHYNRV